MKKSAHTLGTLLGAAVLAIGGAIAPARAQMCKLPPTGNPNCASDSTSQSSPNPSTGVGNPIDLTSGNKYQQETDIEIGGDLSIGFRRHYNSLETQVGVLGMGWSDTYDTRLSRSEQRGTSGAHGAQPPQITVMQADGREIRFEPFETGPAVRRYRSVPAGYGLIEENLGAIERLRSARADGNVLQGDTYSVWKWVWADGRALTFNGRGLLKTIEQPDGRALQVQFDIHRRLSRVTDPHGNWMAAAYWDDAQERLGAFAATQRVTQRGTGYRGRLKSLTLSSGERIQYEYDAHGNLSDVVYADGTIRRYEYDGSSGRYLLSKIYGRDGHLFAAYDYDARGHAIGSSHPDHRDDVKLTYEWPQPKQNVGRTTVENSAGEKTSYLWRADPRAESPVVLKADGPGCRTCAAGNVRYEYDGEGRVIKTVRVDAGGAPLEQMTSSADELGRIRSVELARFSDGRLQPSYWHENRDYSGDNLLPTLITRPSVVPGREHTLRMDYNERGQPVRITERGFQFDENQGQGMLPVAMIDTAATPIERVTTLTYVKLHGLSLLQTVNAPGTLNTLTYEYDAEGRLQSIVHPMHVVERFERDAWGRVIAHTGLDGVRETLEYGGDGHIKRFARGDLSMTLNYDDAGRVSKVLDSLGEQLTLLRDDAGHLVQIADPAGNRIRWDYDERGEVRALELFNPDGSVDQRALPASAGGAASAAASMPNEAMLSAVARSLPDEVAGVLPGSSDQQPSSGFATPAGLRTAYDADGRATVYVYDDFGRMTAQHSPVTGDTRYQWDAADHLIERVTADGSSTRITRDALGRAIRVRAGPEDGRIEWGAANRPTRITFNAGEERFEYDTQARLTSHVLKIDGHEFRISYEFDSLGRVLRKRLPGGEVLRYAYNGALHPKPGVLSAIYKEGLVDRPIITGLNAPDERFSDQGFTFGNGLSQRRVLDLNGNPLKVGNSQVGQSHLDFSNLGQSSATYTRIAHVGDQAAADTPPPMAARLAATIMEFTDPQTPYRVEARENFNVSNTESFDERGQLTSDSQRRYEWDALGRLTRISKRVETGFIRTSTLAPSDERRVIAEYRYDLLGERIAKRVYGANGPELTYFMWDGAELAAEIDQRGKVLRQYVYLEDRPVALLAGRSIYAIHTDHRLAPTAVTDSSRRVVWEAEVHDNGSSDVLSASRLEMPLRASNQYFDAETGLHYNLYRYLDARRGRYLSPDPVGLAAGPDLYRFALGQPHALVDPLGLQIAPADGNITSWSFQTRLQYVLNAAIPKVPGEIGNVLRSMVSPANIAITAGLFTAWAVAQLTPAGWIADAAVAGIGYFFLGETLGHLISLAVQTYQLVNGAKCVSDLDKAATNFAQITSQAVVAIGAYGATKLADVMSEAFKTPAASGVWELSPFQRGVEIEKALGHNVPPSYPTIDIWNPSTGLGTSIKSLDLDAASYQSASALTSQVQGYINTLAKFNGVNRPSLNTLNLIKARELDLVVPGSGTATQQAALQALVASAQKAGVTLKIIIYP